MTDNFKVKIANTKETCYLASFGMPRRDDLKFDLYGPIAETSNKRRILVAESGKLEYVGDTNQTPHYCKYAIGVVDKNTNTITLHDATPVSMTTVVKSLKRESVETIGDKNAAARNKLGQAFGTKKRKQAIKAQEQNVVNVDGLSGVSSRIKDVIATNMPVVPLKDELANIEMADRLIPPCNLNAGKPEDVYNVNDIISADVLSVIDVKSLWRARTASEALTLLDGLGIGTFLQGRIEACLVEKSDKALLKRLIYLAYLCRFYMLKPKDYNNENMGERLLNGASPVVVDSLRGMFLDTVGEGDELKYMLGSKSKDKLLAYILCLCLILNHYSLPVGQIATDLKLSVTSVVKSVKELGARVEQPKKGDTGVRAGKRAVLAIPLSFPRRSTGKK